MSTLRLTGSTSGYTEVTAPAVAGSNTLVLPGGNGTADQTLVTDGSGTLSFADRGRMVLETAQASTSGTEVDFTDIPSWVKRVTVMFEGVSTSGSSEVLVQLGAGSVTTSGYISSGGRIAAAGVEVIGSTAGFLINQDGSTFTHSGSMSICLLSGNDWISTHAGKLNTGQVITGGGDVTLSGTLDRVRITTVNGTDTFDAGSINLLLEG